MLIEEYRRTKPLDSNLKDFLLVKSCLNKNTKKLLSFSVIQIFYKDEEVYEIIRYDTSHEFLHVHKFYNKLDCKSEKLGMDISPLSFRYCRIDILKNWKFYKLKYKDRFINL